MLSRWFLYSMMFLFTMSVAASDIGPSPELQQGIQRFFGFLKKEGWSQNLWVNKASLRESWRIVMTDGGGHKIEVYGDYIEIEFGGMYSMQATERFDVVGLKPDDIKKLCGFCNEVLSRPGVLERYRFQTGKEIMTTGECWEHYNAKLSEQSVPRG